MESNPFLYPLASGLALLKKANPSWPVASPPIPVGPTEGCEQDEVVCQLHSVENK